MASVCLSVCKDPKASGMESGKIKDSQITASSVWDVNHGASNARLNFAQKSGSWSSKSNDLNQWLQVDFKYTIAITEILTQGRGTYGQWVKSYTLSYSHDGVKFIPYKKSGNPKVRFILFVCQIPSCTDMYNIVESTTPDSSCTYISQAVVANQ